VVLLSRRINVQPLGAVIVVLLPPRTSIAAIKMSLAMVPVGVRITSVVAPKLPAALEARKLTLM